MKNLLLVGLLVLCVVTSKAQYEYGETGRHVMPTLGLQVGITAGGFTAMLNNRDDLNADARLDPQMMNFSYGGGVDIVYWFQHTVGFGGQLLYWKGGASYLGKDSLTTLSLKAKSDFTYLKIPLLFHFKSYNRYYPNRRMRFNAMFGPYLALLQTYSDNIDYSDATGKVIASSTVSDEDYAAGLAGELKGSLSKKIYNPLDLGFVFGVGGEMRLWRKTVVSLMLRADIGRSNVENTKDITIQYPNDTKEYPFKPWNGNYAKFVAPNANDVAKGFEANRPATKNFSVGAFLSIRKYLTN